MNIFALELTMMNRQEIYSFDHTVDALGIPKLKGMSEHPEYIDEMLRLSLAHENCYVWGYKE